MLISLLEASHKTGVPKRRLQEAVKKGTLKAAKNAQGQWQVDEANLFKLYPRRNVTKKPADPVKERKKRQDEVIELVMRLKKSARQRDTDQGVEVYDLYLKDLQKELTDRELLETLHGLQQLFGGIDRYGWFNKKESNIVARLKELAWEVGT